MIDQPWTNLNTPKWSNRLLTLVLGISILMTLLVLSPELWDRYRVVKDVQNSYWMARYQDSSLFVPDYLWGGQLMEVNLLGRPLVLYPTSLGWGLLFFLASSVIDHIWFSKLLVFVLISISVIYLFKLGQWVGDNLTGLNLSLFFTFFILASPQSLSPASGLQRGFAVPMLIVFLYYLVRQQYIGAGLMIFINTLIYIPNFFLTVVAYALLIIKIERPFKISLNITRANLLPLISSIIFSGLVMGLYLALRFQWLSSVTLAPGNGGDLFRDWYLSFPWLGRAGVFDTGADVINFLVMAVFGVLIYKIVGRQSLDRLPNACWYLLSAGIIMFILALFFAFQPWFNLDLYYPSRYTRTTLFVVALCYVGFNWDDFLDKGPLWIRKHAALLIFLFISLTVILTTVYLLFSAQLPILPLLFVIGIMANGLLVLLSWAVLFWLLQYPTFWRSISGKTLSQSMPRIVLFVVTIIMIVLGSIYIKTLGLKTPNPSNAARDMYEFVASLSQDVLLAGDPEIMADIPLFSKRNVLFTDLNAGQSNAAVVDFFDAYYAESSEVVLNFCQRYHVDYIVLDEQTFTPAYITKGEFYHQPHNDKIVTMVSDRSNFVLLERQPVFVSGSYRVVQCDAETILANN